MRNGYRAPSPAGRLCPSILFFPHISCIRSDNARKAASSFRSLSPWGRGTASAVDRVLSYIVDLRRSLPLSFIPLPPSNLRPFGAPPSIGRRECPREPLPLEGAAERSEAGLASFWAAKPPPLSCRHCPNRLASLATFLSRGRLFISSGEATTTSWKAGMRD